MKAPATPRILAALLVAFGLFFGRAAGAQPADTVSLAWRAPPECPGADYVHAEVRRLLGAPSPLDKAVSASATVRRAGGATWRLDLSTEGDESKGRRTLQAATCRELANATALVIALMVNPERVRAATKTEPERPPAPAPAPSAPPEEAAPPPPPAAPREEPWRVRGALGVFGVADVGTVPRPGWGLGVSAGAVVWRVRVEAVASAEPNHDVPLPAVGRDGVGATFRKLSGGGRACFTILPWTLEPYACAGAELAYMHASSYGITGPKSGSTTWGEALLGGGVRLALPAGFGVRADGFFGFPSPRREFAIDPYGVVHTLPHVTGRLALGVDVLF